jgi:hypothetical protein
MSEPLQNEYGIVILEPLWSVVGVSAPCSPSPLTFIPFFCEFPFLNNFPLGGAMRMPVLLNYTFRWNHEDNVVKM